MCEPGSRSPSWIPSGRTYIVLLAGDGTPSTARPRPLGTVAAAGAAAARVLARELAHTFTGASAQEVPPSRLRVVAAGSAPCDLLWRALAMDGARMAAA